MSVCLMERVQEVELHLLRKFSIGGNLGQQKVQLLFVTIFFIEREIELLMKLQ